MRIHCWEGYATPYLEAFEAKMLAEHDLKVDVVVTNASRPEEFWHLSRAREVDLISPAHNLLRNERWKFIESGVVLPVNLANVPSYREVMPFLKELNDVRDEGEIFGVPFAIGPYGLAYDSAKVPEPDSWGVLWHADNCGKYVVSHDYPECNIYITALSMGSGDEDIFDYDALRGCVPMDIFEQRLNQLAGCAGDLWSGTASTEQLKKSSYAATWGYGIAQINKDGGAWKMASPCEGTTVWVDHWAITYAVADDPLRKRVCELWIDYCLSPQIQRDMVKNWGVAPVTTNANALLTEDEIQMHHAGDDEYWRNQPLWVNLNTRTTNYYSHLWEKALSRRNQYAPSGSEHNQQRTQ